MARKKEIEEIQSEPPEAAPTKIPDPKLPARQQEQVKTVTDRTNQNALVPPVHLNLEQNRLARLREVARTNRDVRWLLEQHEKK